MEQNLFVGFDLSDEFSQLSCYNEKTYEVDTIFCEPDEYLIPTVLGIKKDTKEWTFGKEAILSAKKGESILLDHIIHKLQVQSKIAVFEGEVSGEVLLEKFFRKTLSLLKRHYPNNSIKKLAITLDSLDKPLIDMIYKALENMGIEKDRVVIQNHEQSYVYYALSQKKELWMNDVGLFEFNEKGLYYYQITMNRKATPMAVSIQRKDYSETLSYDMLGCDKETLSYIFESIAKSALFKQIISTLYISGNGFEGTWAEEVFQDLAIGRRVFKGMNLYTKGACYCAREKSGAGKIEDFIFLGDDVVTSTISMRVYFNAKLEEVILVKAGTPWYEVNQTFDIITDQEEEIEIIVNPLMKREKEVFLIHIGTIKGRPNKTTRLTLKVKFIDGNTCAINVKDQGFGELYPTSNRIWETKIVCR